MISGPLISAEEALGWLYKAVFLDARAGPETKRDFVREHVESAGRADLETDLSQVTDPRAGGRHPLPPLEVWLDRVGGWGIGRTTPVVIYDAVGGGMAAARAWWMLRAVGHEPVAVVDGGWPALRRGGAPTRSGRSDPYRAKPRAPYPSAVEAWPAVDADFVEHVRDDSSWRLLDARSPERYAGDVEPIDPFAGHIRGALNLHWQSQLDDGGMLDKPETLRARYEALLGDVSPERVVCYCGSGVTACHLLLAMEACGLHGARLYVGSWSEWCRTRGGAT